MSEPSMQQHTNFSLGILEYCSVKKLLKREDYYIKLLNPEYNVHPKAGSPLGFKHNEE
jgi:group I intron endonuclease